EVLRQAGRPASGEDARASRQQDAVADRADRPVEREEGADELPQDPAGEVRPHPGRVPAGEHERVPLLGVELLESDRPPELRRALELAVERLRAARGPETAEDEAAEHLLVGPRR